MPRIMEVSERALIGRINRKLAPDRRAIRKARAGGRLRDNLRSDFYLLDTYSNCLLDDGYTMADLMDLGRELGCVHELEVLAQAA
jgi:hypothetical protein